MSLQEFIQWMRELPIDFELLQNRELCCLRVLLRSCLVVKRFIVELIAGESKDLKAIGGILSLKRVELCYLVLEHRILRSSVHNQCHFIL